MQTTQQRALIADSERKLQQLMDGVVEETERKGLEINKKESCVMVFSKKENKPTCNTTSYVLSLCVFFSLVYLYKRLLSANSDVVGP